jgi:hypothetical protein
LLTKALERNRSTKIIVLSEEPLWITMWSEHKFNDSSTLLRDASSGIEYFQLSCLNTKLYKELPVPYFITTEAKYIARYSLLLSRNATLSPKEVVASWGKTKFKYAYIGERRQGPLRTIDLSKPHGIPLSSYRTHLAEEVQSNKLVAGMGWKSDGTPRQALSDWHLNKLGSLHASTKYVSAIENTYVDSYITEKPFDALASLAIPVVWAPAFSELFQFIPEHAVLEVHSYSSSEAAKMIDSLTPSEDQANALIDASRDLLFNKLTPQRVNLTRRLVVNRLVDILLL